MWQGRMDLHLKGEQVSNNWGEHMALSLLHHAHGLTSQTAGDRIIALAQRIENERIQMTLDHLINVIQKKGTDE